MHVAAGQATWKHNPPHSGPHAGSTAAWGVSTTPVPRANWVHNLEHGGVVLLYRCPEGCDAERAVLEAVAKARPDKRILVTPDPELEGSRFAAVAWTWVFTTDAPELASLICFVDQHEGHAPEDVR